MTLKQVVLPAPLGPIRPRISPSRMSKDTWSSAVTPPNRMVTSSTSSRARPGFSEDIDRFSFQFLDLLLGSERPPGPAWRQQPLWSPDRQQHQRQAEEQQTVVGEVPEPLGQVRHDRAAEDRTPAVAGPADDHRGHEEHGQQQREALRVDVAALAAGVERAREAADGRAHREREQLVAER